MEIRTKFTEIRQPIAEISQFEYWYLNTGISNAKCWSLRRIRFQVKESHIISVLHSISYKCDSSPDRVLVFYGIDRGIVGYKKKIIGDT